jgi:hypothetical protein
MPVVKSVNSSEPIFRISALRVRVMEINRETGSLLSTLHHYGPIEKRASRPIPAALDTDHDVAHGPQTIKTACRPDP